MMSDELHCTRSQQEIVAEKSFAGLIMKLYACNLSITLSHTLESLLTALFLLSVAKGGQKMRAVPCFH